MGQLNTFPLSYKVKGRRIVIVGGGEEALNKARLASKTTAEVVIVSRHIEIDFSEVSPTITERAFEPDDLINAAMVFVADDGPDGETAKLAARARGIPLNVVDVPDECDFFTPAIVDRAPVTIAISSEGDAPVLARLIRAKIEALLSPELGLLAGLARELRHRVMSLLPPGAARRRFFEELVTSSSIDAALAQGLPNARREAMRLLDNHASHAAGEGIVWLIGAGPGSEDLLTLRAQRLLQQADVIVHDQLVPSIVVEMGRRDAHRISVGKAKGKHSFTQSEINDLLVVLAKEGKRVARLKSGDPMIFGRAGEEIAALRAHHIAYSIVPGVTAALAAAADTATPVTLRGVSNGFVVATAHGADDAELEHWASLAQAGLTLCIYMGKSIAAEVSARLIDLGVDPQTPVGIVTNAGRATRSMHRGTVLDLAAGRAVMSDGPAVILIGKAVAAGDWSEAIALTERAAQVA